MRVVVTGHLGYIGCHLVDLLVRDGHWVKGVDIDLYEGCDFSALPAGHENQKRDIFDLRPDDFDGIDAVMHLAGLSNDPVGQLNPALTWYVNHQGTMHVAECAKAAGVPRFIFSSSCSVYGVVAGRAVNESDRVEPVTAYGQTKIQSELDLARLANESFSPVYLRNATAYGASPRLRLDLVVNNLAAWAVTTGEIRIMSDGTPWRPLIHCADIARAFMHVAAAPRELIHDQVFNVGRTEENYQVRDIVNLVLEALPSSRAVYTGEGALDARDYRVDFSKFEQTFPDFQFSRSVPETIAELVRLFRQGGLTLADVEGSRYTRLKKIRETSWIDSLPALVEG